MHHDIHSNTNSIGVGWLREYMGHSRYIWLKKIGRLAPRFAHSRVRECGTSGHAAAH